ncbi:hypothetical protein [Aeromonas jandaei]|uniref:hypothetical protein n=1 Tax=Aeromonas jandaei TaxID=650 RepID=UPI003B9F1211
MKTALISTMVFIFGFFIGSYLGLDFVIIKTDNIPQKTLFDYIGLLASIGSFILAIFMAFVAVYIYVKWDSRHKDEKIVDIKLEIYDAICSLDISCKNLTCYYDRNSRFKNDDLINSVNEAHLSLEKAISKFYFFISEDNKFNRLTHSIEKNDFLKDSKRLLHISRALCHFFSIGGFKAEGQFMLRRVKEYDSFTEQICKENIFAAKIDDEYPASYINVEITKIRDKAIHELIIGLYQKI